MNHSALGGTWDELQKVLLDKGYLTPEEIAASDSRVARIGEQIQVRQENEIDNHRQEDKNHPENYSAFGENRTAVSLTASS